MSKKLEDNQECLANSECLHGNCLTGVCTTLSGIDAYCSPDADHCAKGPASADLVCSTFSHRCVPPSEAGRQSEKDGGSCKFGYDCSPDSFCSPEGHVCVKRKATNEPCVMVTMDRFFEDQCLDGLFCDDGICKEGCRFDSSRPHAVTGTKRCKQVYGSFGVWEAAHTQDAPGYVLWIVGKFWVVPIALLLLAIVGLFIAWRLCFRSSSSS